MTINILPNEILAEILAFSCCLETNQICRRCYSLFNLVCGILICDYYNHSPVLRPLLPKTIVPCQNSVVVRDLFNRVFRQAHCQRLFNSTSNILHRSPMNLVSVAQEIVDHNLCVFFSNLKRELSSEAIRSFNYLSKKNPYALPGDKAILIRQWMHDHPEYLRNVTELEIINNKCITGLPPELNLLTNLQELNLQGCTGLTTLSDTMDILTHLNYLGVEGCTEQFINTEAVQCILSRIE